MAYETGTATGMLDLLTKLSAFAVANGWTEDVFVTGAVALNHLALHKGTVFVQFKYDIATGHIAMYQSLAYSGASAGNQTGDSGSGDYSYAGAVDVGRRIFGIGNLAYPAYYFFAGTNYIHCVLEFQPGIYRHFGFGEIVKFGTWTGGEYCLGHTMPSAAGLNQPWASTGAFLMDGNSNTGTVDFQNTIHIEGMPNQVVNGKWGVFGLHTFGSSTGVDRAGIQRIAIMGGIKGGLLEAHFGWFQGNPANGFIPMFPINCYYRSISPEKWRLIGYMPDTRNVNITFINPAEEIVLGANTWKFFPWWRKGDAPAPAGTVEWSGHMGVAYLKS